MNTTLPFSSVPAVGAISADLLPLSPLFAPTPLCDLPRLAGSLDLRQVLVKDEGQRTLGNFKSLGGTYAGLRALARCADRTIAGLVAEKPGNLPALVCASDGNHGLAVAMAARLAGAQALVYLHAGVPAARARRIEAEGAQIIRVAGTYDDSVLLAAREAAGGAGILVPDTTAEPSDPIVADVMAGYGVIASEIRDQVAEAGFAAPTHMFVQAGVGGLAAAMADGLAHWLSSPATLVVVEPQGAACVAAAFTAHRVKRIKGALHTAAEMLSCGEASTPALAVLLRHCREIVLVAENELASAPHRLREAGGPATTPSGAAGLAGLCRALGDAACATRLGLTRDSRILLIVTEGELGQQ